MSEVVRCSNSLYFTVQVCYLIDKQEAYYVQILKKNKRYAVCE